MPKKLGGLRDVQSDSLIFQLLKSIYGRTRNAQFSDNSEARVVSELEYLKDLGISAVLRLRGCSSHSLPDHST